MPFIKLWDYKISHWHPLEWQHLPTKFHENLLSGSKDIHRSFRPEACHAFRSFCSSVKNMVTIVTMVHKEPNPLFSKTYLTNLNLNNFKILNLKCSSNIKHSSSVTLIRAISYWLPPPPLKLFKHLIDFNLFI
jgi:hypothetical protein